MADAMGSPAWSRKVTAEAATRCTVCLKKGTNGNVVKHCGRCKTPKYCSQECQSAHWKYHKVDCKAKEEGTSTDKSKTTIPRGLSSHFGKPFHALHDRKFLHFRPEADVYKLLIDCYRLRLDDDYKFLGEVPEDSIYGGAQKGYSGFVGFLTKADEQPNLLPVWWSADKWKACLRFGQRGGFHNWSDLNTAIEKSDVMEEYGDSLMPMKWRMLGQ